MGGGTLQGPELAGVHAGNGFEGGGGWATSEEAAAVIQGRGGVCQSPAVQMLVTNQYKGSAISP